MPVDEVKLKGNSRGAARGLAHELYLVDPRKQQWQGIQLQDRLERLGNSCLLPVDGELYVRKIRHQTKMRGLQPSRIRIKIVIENRALGGCRTVNPDPIRQPKNWGFDEAQEQGQDNDSRGHEPQCRYWKVSCKDGTDNSKRFSSFEEAEKFLVKCSEDGIRVDFVTFSLKTFGVPLRRITHSEPCRHCGHNIVFANAFSRCPNCGKSTTSTKIKIIVFIMFIVFMLFEVGPCFLAPP